MPTTITADGNLDVNSKNLMLNQWARTATNINVQRSRSVFAANAAGEIRSTTDGIAFNIAENGRISLSSPFSLTINNDSEGANAIKKIIIEPLTGTDGGAVFELDEAIDFPIGGSIFIPLIEIELEDV